MFKAEKKGDPRCRTSMWSYGGYQSGNLSPERNVLDTWPDWQPQPGLQSDHRHRTIQKGSPSFFSFFSLSWATTGVEMSSSSGRTHIYTPHQLSLSSTPRYRMLLARSQSENKGKNPSQIVSQYLIFARFKACSSLNAQNTQLSLLLNYVQFSCWCFLLDLVV